MQNLNLGVASSAPGLWCQTGSLWNPQAGIRCQKEPGNLQRQEDLRRGEVNHPGDPGLGGQPHHCVLKRREEILLCLNNIPVGEKLAPLQVL
ncbi:hypothetical protein LEMLEM_LOCUS13591 [Lemmus lemmus]